MERYHTCFILFLVTAIALFLLLAALFFLFDIRRIIWVKTGWEGKKRVRDFQARYQSDETDFVLPDEGSTQKLDVTQEIMPQTLEEEWFEVVGITMVMEEKELQGHTESLEVR